MVDPGGVSVPMLVPGETVGECGGCSDVLDPGIGVTVDTGVPGGVSVPMLVPGETVGECGGCSDVLDPGIGVTVGISVEDPTVVTTVSTHLSPVHPYSHSLQTPVVT